MTEEPTSHPDASLALGLAVLGLAGSLLVLPLIASPVAMFLGRRALRQIDANPGHYADRSQVRAAYLLGVAGTVLLGAVVAVLFVLVALSAISVMSSGSGH